MVKPEIKIVHLYAREMNIYGDNGNVLALSYRAKKYGIKVSTTVCNVGNKLDKGVDIIVAGGGQDRGQLLVQEDILKRAQEVKSMLNDGVVCLTVCGMYQLLGHEFITSDGQKIKGISYFDMTTKATDKRLIGNIIIRTDVGRVVGFENHSGQTFLAGDQPAFGEIVKGFGNNQTDKTEGAQLNNTIGTYLHGPILPKNIKLTDDLLKRALIRKYGNSHIMNEHLDDSIADKAAQIAAKRA